MDTQALLADLDADQRHAVTTDSQMVAVIAGAGSGKTRVLTRRVAYRIATGSADASHTVVLTFTREAAGELRRRLPRLGLTDRIAAGTFHSISQGILRQRWLDLGKALPTLLTDRRRIVGDVMGRADLDELVASMDWATARGITPNGYEAAARSAHRRSSVDATRVAEALEKYRREKRSRGVVDLDDLLALTIEEIERDTKFADTVRWRFRHVLVDEAQDLNPLQHRLVDLLRNGRDDLFLVGDPAQAIYGFNGSDPTLLTNVAERFAGIEIIRLPVNHRSTPQIVDAGAHVLIAGGQPTAVRSARPDGAAIEIIRHEDDKAEAESIAMHIARLDPTLLRRGQVAVLGRTNAVLVPTRESLLRLGIPVRRVVDGAGSLLASHLATAYRTSDSNQFRRWAYDEFEAAQTSSDLEQQPRSEVAAAMMRFLREVPTGDGVSFRSWVSTTDPFGADIPGVHVLTFHGAKGLEWDTVFLIGCETSLVPHRAATTNEAKAEETRLLYVALTRATDFAFVNWSGRRGGYQRKLTPLLSEFKSEASVALPPPPELRIRHTTSHPASLERLVVWRSSAARARGILPEEICSDQALSAIASSPPATSDELSSIAGIGPITASRLFSDIAAALVEP